MGNAAGVNTTINVSFGQVAHDTLCTMSTKYSAKASGKATLQQSVTIRGITYKPNFFLLDENVSTGHFEYKTIGKNLLKICEDSWIKIVSNYHFPPRGPKEKSKIHVLFATFFNYFEDIDGEGECVSKFKVSARSYIPNRDALLLRVIKYLLSVPNDSTKVKTKLRSLGRAHARRGIEEKHFRVFAQALMMTFVDALGSGATNTIIGAWVELLSFVIHQMSFDKVYFPPRAHEHKDMRSLDMEDNSPSIDMDSRTISYSVRDGQQTTDALFVRHLMSHDEEMKAEIDPNELLEVMSV